MCLRDWYSNGVIVITDLVQGLRVYGYKIANNINTIRGKMFHLRTAFSYYRQ